MDPTPEILGLDTRLAYTALVFLIALQRLGELAVSKGNERRLRARGATEAGAGHYPVMVGLHTAFLVASVAEVWLLGRPFVPLLAAAMLVLLVAASCLRLWVIRSLAGRWTTRVLCLPGEPPISTGPYRWVRHPNYLAVALEIVALPLVHGAWATAALFTAANVLLLRHRIRCEEGALSETGGYAERFGDRPRFVPGGGGRQTRDGEP